MKRCLFIAVCLAFGPVFVPGAGAEIVKTLTVGSTYDNNAYGSATGQPDYITQLNVSLSRAVDGVRSRLETYASGGGNIFAQSESRTFSMGSVGMGYARLLGKGRNILSAGGSVSFRLDRSDYTVYNYVGIQTSVNGKWYLKPSVQLRVGYDLRWRNYWNLDAYRYTEHELSAQISKFLPTGTTLRAEAGFGYKRYENGAIGAVPVGPFRTAGFSLQPGRSSKGQVVLALDLAQSLSAHTGLSFRYQARLNTTSGASALSAPFTTYTDDDNPFNDRYDYEGGAWTVRLTRQFSSRLRATIEGGYEARNYPNDPALDLGGSPVAAMRQDRITFGTVAIEKALLQNLKMSVRYNYERNRSNDLYYKYNGRHTVSAGFVVGF